MNVVFPSMPKGEIVGNMEIHVGIDGIRIDSGYVMMIGIDGIMILMVNAFKQYFKE